MEIIEVEELMCINGGTSGSTSNSGWYFDPLNVMDYLPGGFVSTSKC